MDGKDSVDKSWQGLLQGLRAGARKPTNMSKTTELHQKPDESPMAFYERLCEAFWTDTPSDPETAENQRILMLPLRLNPVQTSNESSESWKALLG